MEKRKGKGKRPHGNQKWTPEQDAIMKKWYPKYGATGKKGCVQRIFDATGVLRTRSSIKNRSNFLKLMYKGPPKTVFHKGHVPHNKGKKLSEETKEKLRKLGNQFKKGNLPHNTKPVGTATKRADNYWEIKIAMPNEWELLHRVIYENTRGVKLQEDDVVRFIDKDVNNMHPDNLEVVTRREHMLKNNTKIKVYDKELYDVIAIMSKIQKILRDNGRTNEKDD